jgi:sugar/nucleoside kinase (ribokinase family)
VKTGLSVILSRGADRAILTYSGSIGALRYSDIDPALVSRARHLHLGSYFLLDSLRPDTPKLFHLASRQGVTVSMDTNYDPSEHWDGGVQEALRGASIFLPNEKELCAIARQPTVESALATMDKKQIVAVKLGARGAVARFGDTQAQADSVSVEVVDTTGAGDTFDAGFIYGFLAKWDLARILRFACVCGSLSTRAAGGTAAQPNLQEALEWMPISNLQSPISNLQSPISNL